MSEGKNVRVISLNQGDVSPCRNCARNEELPKCFKGCLQIKAYQEAHPISECIRCSLFRPDSEGIFPFGCRQVGLRNFQE